MRLTDKIFQVSCPYNNPYQGNRSRVLFVCSAGLLRSPTAAVLGAAMGMNTRSCGSHGGALIPISANLIEWAAHIYFMDEHCHLEALETFRGKSMYEEQLLDKAKVWDIHDDYEYMHPELVSIIAKLLS